MIHFKDILLEAMRPNVATTIFAKYGVRNAAHLDKGQLRKYYMALAKRNHSDAGGKDEDMKWINAAYDVLKKNAKDVIDVELKPEDKLVTVFFTDANSGETLQEGQCNHAEYSEIINKLNEDGIEFTAAPPNQKYYDTVNDEWLVASIAILIDPTDFYMVQQYIEPFFKH